MTRVRDPLDGGRLDPVRHADLAAHIEDYARTYGVTPADVSGHAYALTEDEVAYLRGFRRAQADGTSGIIYVGAHHPPVLARARSIVGALARNFIDARLIVREELVSELFAGGRIAYDLVAVPDLHYDGAPLSTKRALSSWLMGRAARGLQTVVAVPDRASLHEVMSWDAGAASTFRVLIGATETRERRNDSR